MSTCLLRGTSTPPSDLEGAGRRGGWATANLRRSCSSSHARRHPGSLQRRAPKKQTARISQSATVEGPSPVKFEAQTAPASKNWLISTAPVSQSSTASAGISVSCCLVGRRSSSQAGLYTAALTMASTPSTHLGPHSCKVLELPAMRVFTSTALHAAGSQPRYCPVSTCIVGPRQHEADGSPSENASCCASHQWRMHGMPPAAGPAGSQAAPRCRGRLSASCSPSAGTVANVPSSSFPATWLWSSAKISGTPVSSEIEETMPYIVPTPQRKATRTTGPAQNEVQPTSATSPFWTQVLHGSPVLDLVKDLRQQPLDPGEAERAPLSWTETSTTRSRTRSARLSSITMRGGMKRTLSTNTLMTHRPMNSPNSRSGCKQLARFAKKLIDVVNDVARQLFPACARNQGSRACRSLRWLLCSQ
mmetsp:Transcript_98919/g.280207  ORF Transcript_98919/g.280207 Transcript_98919/m.280207 type:complete len:418 (+) Transcript_98919:424-1677(+)